MSLAPGTKLGPYAIVAPLGAGGMGEVYHARDPRLGRDVAIKVLPQAVAGDVERLARFQREARALAAVNHPNIAQVFGLEDGPSDTSAIVMELVEGEDLSAMIARGPIPVADAVLLARQIADALEAAHEQGIIHRDLKPGNIRVRGDGTVKVLDFGLAKPVENAGSATSAAAPTITTPAMTHEGVVLGTAAYMSPEQAKGKAVDRRTDIWSFDAVVYEMLTAARAFPGEDVTDAIASIVAKEPDWTRLPASTPQAIRTLLQRCVIKDARRRLRDIGEARLILDDVAAGRESDDEAPRPAARSIWMAVALGSIVMAVAVIAAFTTLSRRGPAAPPVVTRFAITLPRDYAFVRASTRLIALSPNASHLVHVGNRRLYLRALSELESRPIQGTNTDPTDPFFSPDGQWVGYFSISDAKLRKVAITGGAPVELANFGRSSVGAFQGGVWAGDEILFASAGKGIMRLAPSGGEPELVVAVEQGLSYGPLPLPGGDVVLFSRTTDATSDRWDKAEVVAYSRRTKQTSVVLRGGTAVKYLPSGHLVYAFGTSIIAVPFNASSLEVTGPPVTVAESVRRAVDATSGAAQFVVSESGIAADVPDARVTDTGHSTLALIDGKGTATPLGFAPNNFGPPRISPDGRQLAVGAVSGVNLQDGAVWVAELKPGATLRRLTFEGRNLSPIWSADSRWIYFVSDGAGEPTLMRQLADGSGTAERVASVPGLARPEAETPDGKALIVSAGPDLWIVDSGGNRKPLTSHQGLERALSMSPDGRWFAYNLTQGRDTNVFVEPFPPTGARYQITTTGGSSPLWSPDGRRLFYNPLPGVPGANSRTLVAVDVTTTPTFAFGPPRPVPIGPGVLTSPRNFDITPDGRYFLMTLPPASLAPSQEAAPEEIRVVLNWIEELKRKVPTP